MIKTRIKRESVKCSLNLVEHSTIQSIIQSFKILLVFLFIFQSILTAEVRYVSKTGSSTPPYTSWETASDSIQKAINICNDGDTIYVANGIYKEKLKIDRHVILIGSSMDSTVIDGRGLVGTGQDSIKTIAVYAQFEMSNFHVYGHIGTIIYTYFQSTGMIIKDCIIENGGLGVNFYNGYNRGENLIIRNVKTGIWISDLSGDAFYDINNNLILTNKRDATGIRQNLRGSSEITNNIILNITSESTEAGIDLNTGFPGRSIIKNNLVAGFQWQQYDDANVQDSIFVINNVFGYTRQYNLATHGALYLSRGEKRIVKNNIIFNTKIGIEVNNNPSLAPDYNLYWNLEQKYKGSVTGDNEIFADPMVMKDTLPTSEMKLDVHLQAFSPAIDAGDPNILDVDGTRSDIGMFGGPGGEIYKYIDLAPREPRGLTISTDTNYVTLRWLKNSEADFSRYNLYRDTVPGFTADSLSFIFSLRDTFYTHPIIPGSTSYYYKLSAVDSQDNESELSDELGIIVSVDDEYQVVDEYRLYQNYPNPFNPSTKISFRLKERGYVKIMVYDIKGERIKVLLNEEKETGYYETEFNAEGLSSGIYLYRIEVIGKGNIPVFSDMKKMIHLK